MQDLEPLLMEKNLKIDLTKLNVHNVKDFQPALGNTFICVDLQNNQKKVMHFTHEGKFIAELSIK
jgi:hypothetical protein